MSDFDKRLERTIEHGIENGTKATGKFFLRVWEGIKTLKLPENRRSFLITLAIIIILAGAAEYFGAREIKKEFIGELLYKQKIIRWPIGLLVLLGGVLIKLYFSGRDLTSEKLHIAFERTGLSSQRKVFDLDSQKLIQEYPRIIRSSRLLDGGLFIILKNPGLALETWKKAAPAIEATFEKKCTRIDFHEKNPGLICLKIGGSELPDAVQYSKELISGATKSQVIVGLDKDGKKIVHDFKAVPHLLIAGSTGSGKSVELRYIAYQTISQQDANLWAIDFKGGIEFEPFEALGVECVWEREQALTMLNFLIEEHHIRVATFKKCQVKNIDEYNKTSPKKPLKRCYVAIDELAELTNPTGAPASERELFEAVEGALSTLARLARATGIHLLPATQRPEAKVMTGQIKTNITGRICAYLPDIPASQIVVSGPHATKLDNIPGRFLYTTGNRFTEFQAPYFQDEHMDKSIKVDYTKGMLLDYQEYLSETAETPSLKAKTRNMRVKRI